METKWDHGITFLMFKSMASFYGDNKTNIGISMEHLSRYTQPVHKLKQMLFLTKDAASPVDKEKANIDNISLEIFNKLLEKQNK